MPTRTGQISAHRRAPPPGSAARAPGGARGRAACQAAAARIFMPAVRPGPFEVAAGFCHSGGGRAACPRPWPSPRPGSRSPAPAARMPAALTQFGHADRIFSAFLGFHTTTRPAFMSSLLASISPIVSSSFRMSMVSASLHVRGRARAHAADSGAFLPCAGPPSFEPSNPTDDVKQLLRPTASMRQVHQSPCKPAAPACI